MMRRAFVLFLFFLPASVGAACSCSESSSSSSGDGTTSSASTTGAPGGSGGAAGGGPTGGGGGLVVGGECKTDGDECDGGVCAGGACCGAASACGSACCGAGEVCAFQKCVEPGALCIDATECPEDHYCEYALGEPSDAGAPDASCQGGAVLATGKCLPKPPECAPGVEPKPDEPLTCLPKCEHQPSPGKLAPVLKYAWGDANAPGTKDSIMMAPVVIQLDDDTCDGVVDERDIPEIVFTTFVGATYETEGTLRAISIVDGKVVEKWSATAPGPSSLNAGRAIAAGNIDGKPGNEVVVCTADQRVRAYDAGGKELWLSPPGAMCFMPSLADLDQDGDVEVVVESQILDGKTGTPVVAAFDPPNTANVVVYDIDGDGKLDIVSPSRAYGADGKAFIDTGLPGNYPAIGDLDADGVPEVVVADKLAHELVVWHVDPAAPGKFEVVREGVDINGAFDPDTCPPGSVGNTKGGGPPTVADFNGDGFPDAALAGGIGYAVLDGAKLMDPAVPDGETYLWLTKTQDCSSASTGSSVFDFEGDGKAEVVYGDEQRLHVYSGTDGSVLFETCNTNGTLWEYPLVADVDNDGQADIVVVSNSYSDLTCDGAKTAGVRVFGDANGNWVRTRRVWNQHAYHVTNVLEDGTIPAVEAANHLQPKLNNFRQNVQPLGELSAPDLVVSLAPKCWGDYGLVARVRNIGEAAVPAGVPVGFYVGHPAAGGVALTGSPVPTTKVLYPAEAEDVVLLLPDPPPGVKTGAEKLYAVADDGAPAHAWHECRVDNNVSLAASGLCAGGPK